jgi:serine/threonine protein kinase
MAASNPRWLAPEILSGRGYTFSSDIYSFGIILWEFMTWRVPWHECGPWQVVALVTEHGHRPDIPSQEEMAGMTGSTFPGYEEYVELINQCWAQDAEARPNFNDIIKVLRRLLAKELNARKSLQRRGSLSSQGSVPPDLRSDIMRSGATEEIAEVAHSSATNSHEKSSTTNSHEKSSGEEIS